MQQHIHRMEENLAGHFSWLPRATPGMAVEERDGLLLASSGLPCDSFNVLFCRGRLSDADLREAVGYFQTRGLPFAAGSAPTHRPRPCEKCSDRDRPRSRW